MSALEQWTGPAVPAIAPAPHRDWRPLREQATVFVIAAAVFTVLGIWTTVRLHVLYGDAESRLMHAYMLWWNLPAKAAAIGFVWPPLQTLALLPFTLIKPLSTSLVALPLFSGVCGGALIAVLNRTLKMIGLGRAWRYPLLALFSANPIFLDYTGNGMAEILTMLLLSLGIHYFVRWYLSGGSSIRALSLSGLWMAAAFMTRYETVVWIAAILVCVLIVQRRRDSRADEVEAGVLLFLMPVVYASAIWGLINTVIVGGPPWSFLTRAGGQGAGNDQGKFIAHASTLRIVSDVVAITGRISPLLWTVPILLLAIAIVRRSRFDLAMAGLVLVGVVTTVALVLLSPHVGLLQPRYNLRSLPVALIGAGWAIRSLPRGAWRAAGALAVVLSLLAALPLAARVMWNYPYQFAERAWIRGLTTGDNQDGTRSFNNGYAIGYSADQRMGDFIAEHVHGFKTVLVDDASLPGVILLSGRPNLFVTRIDHGDGRWMRILAHPRAHVRYILVRTVAGDFANDLIAQRYPALLTGAFPDSTVVYRTADALLVRLDPAVRAG